MRLLKIVALGLSAVALAVFGAAYSPVGSAQQPAAQKVTLFEGARLLVGTDTAPIENSAFLVEGNRFTRVGRRGEIQAPAGATRVDLTGKTVMPGLIDLHSHVGYEDSTKVTEEKENYTRANLIDHLERYAYTGHALTQSLGSDPPEDFVWQMREDSMKLGFQGARFFTTGQGLAWPGTGPIELSRNDTAFPIVSTWQARIAVRQLASHKVKFVKLWLEDRGGYEVPQDRSQRQGLIDEHGIPAAGRPFQLTPAIYRAAIDEAKKVGVRTLGHVKTLGDVKDMIRAGIDGWTHPIADFPIDDEMIGLLKARPNMRYAPVITPAGSGGSAPRAVGERPAWLKDPLLGAIKCQGFLERWGQQFEKSKTVPPPMGNLGVQNVAKIYKAGTRIVLGSHDAGTNRIIGWGSHMEMESWVNWVGMPPKEVIVASTSAAAEFLGVTDMGSVATGKLADFIVLDANPLDDIRNTRKISQVYLRGAEINRTALRNKWKTACDTFERTN